MRSACLLALAFAFGIAPLAAAAEDGVTASWSFDAKDDASAFEATVTGERVRKGSEPGIRDGKLHLLQSWWKFAASVGFAAPAGERHREVEVSFKLVMNTGTEGAGFAWLDVERFGESGKAPEVEGWEAPSLPGSFGVGFDARNPVNRDPFRGSGNAYDRPQHELSLHWDGMEIVKATTPMDFRDEEDHSVLVRFVFVPGGADVTVRIDGDAVFDAYFIPSMTAYVGRPAFGGRNVETAGDVLIDDLALRLRGPVPAPEPPVEVVAIDRKLNDKKHKKNEAEVAFPEETDRFARIIMTLRLDKPETRFDPWDRLASIYAYADDGERFEVLRYITPYHRGHVWKVDVTDFRPLLRGKRRIEQVCGTQGEGWVVTVSFVFYPGETDRLAYRLVNLWSGSPEVGNPDEPVEGFYVPRRVKLDEETAFAKVRTVVTGHGMSPNTNNAAEFMPIGRTLTVNGQGGQLPEPLPAAGRHVEVRPRRLGAGRRGAALGGGRHAAPGRGAAARGPVRARPLRQRGAGQDLGAVAPHGGAGRPLPEAVTSVREVVLRPLAAVGAGGDDAEGPPVRLRVVEEPVVPGVQVDLGRAVEVAARLPLEGERELEEGVGQAALLLQEAGDRNDEGADPAAGGLALLRVDDDVAREHDPPGQLERRRRGVDIHEFGPRGRDFEFEHGVLRLDLRLDREK